MKCSDIARVLAIQWYLHPVILPKMPQLARLSPRQTTETALHGLKHLNSRVKVKGSVNLQ